MEFNEKVAFQNDIFVYSLHNPLVLVNFVITLSIFIAIYLYIVCISWLIIRKMSKTRELMSTKTYKGHKQLLVALGVQVTKASRLG
jgi:purine-cytosine permease-like protein